MKNRENLERSICCSCGKKRYRDSFDIVKTFEKRGLVDYAYICKPNRFSFEASKCLKNFIQSEHNVLSRHMEVIKENEKILEKYNVFKN